MNPELKYRAGYKYQVHETYIIQTRICPAEFILSRFIRLAQDGMLYVLEGYAWDGPSGPTIDTKNFMVGSLVHDALCQLIREGHLDHDKWQEPVDKELTRLTKEDGMWAIRRAWVYWGARIGDGGNAANERPILTAP